MIALRNIPIGPALFLLVLALVWTAAFVFG